MPVRHLLSLAPPHWPVLHLSGKTGHGWLRIVSTVRFLFHSKSTHRKQLCYACEMFAMCSLGRIYGQMANIVVNRRCSTTFKSPHTDKFVSTANRSAYTPSIIICAWHYIALFLKNVLKSSQTITESTHLYNLFSFTPHFHYRAPPRKQHVLFFLLISLKRWSQ